MADRTVGALPRAPDLYDDSLLVIEQQGEARSLTGGQLKGFARAGVAGYVEDAQKAAETAREAVKAVGNAVDAAQAAQTGAETARKATRSFSRMTSYIRRTSCCASPMCWTSWTPWWAIHMKRKWSGRKHF